jgi:type II secretion system protein D
MTATAQTGTVVAAKPTAQVLQMVNLPADKIEANLRSLLGTRLRRIENREPDAPGWMYVHSAKQRVELLFDYRQNNLTLRGPDGLVDQLTRLILALERASVPSARATAVVPLHQADPAQVLRVIEAYRSERRGGGSPSTGAVPNSGNPTSGNEATPRAGDTSSLGNPQSAVPLAGATSAAGQRRLAVYRSQSPDDVSALPAQPAAPVGQQAAPPPAAAQPSPAATPEQEENGTRQPVKPKLRSMDSDLEVETLSDLDAMILRGRPRDLAELRRIIEEIERLSAETQPEIEIVYLKHAGSESLGGLIKQLEKEFTGGRQGRVSTIPLIKPNALLLIGWGEALKSAKELIAKLDLPVPPETQFQVFPLRNATAEQAHTAIQNFFGTRGGLGTQVRVIADARTNSLIVQGSPRDLEEVKLLLQPLDQPRGEAVRQARVFKLRNSLASDVAQVLQRAISGQGAAATGRKIASLEMMSIDSQGQKVLRSGVLTDVQITADVRANSLVVEAPAESMPLLDALIQQLDTPAAVAQIKVFRITNGDATSLAAMLRVLLPSAGTSGPGGASLAAAEGESTLVPIRFSVDLRTNSIIASGSEGDLSIIYALLLRLDEDKGTLRKNAVVRLKNSPALDAARTLNEYLRSEKQVQQVTPGFVNPFQQIEREVIVVPEKVSNSLIVSATPRFFDDIMELVTGLDKEPPQVMIQVVLAQITLNDTDEFGMELGLQDSVLFNRSLLSNLVTQTNTTQTSTPSGIVTQTQNNILGATNTPGYNFNNLPLGNSGGSSALSNAAQVGGQGLSSFNLARNNADLGYGGLVLSASSESVSFLLRALKQTQRLDVLSRPQVMTLDNQPAFIQVGQRVPRITGSTITTVGQQNNIVLENVGLILGVTPRISPDGRVIMEVDAEKSSVNPVAAGIPVTTSNGVVINSPTFDLTTAQTTVSAIDGETIVMGGLLTNSNNVTHRRVPLLSDVPILGMFFRYDSTVKEKTEMLIILTPHIIRSPVDAERVRSMEESRMHWCMGDVNAIDGPVGFNAKKGVPAAATIYPDANPRGKVSLPESKVPQPLPEATSESIPPGMQTPPPPSVQQPQP